MDNQTAGYLVLGAAVGLGVYYVLTQTQGGDDPPPPPPPPPPGTGTLVAAGSPQPRLFVSVL